MKNLPRLLIIIGVPLVTLALGGGFFFRDRITALFSPKAKLTTITYWGLFEPPAVMAPLINEYQLKNPNVRINYQLQTFPSFSQYKKTLTTRLDQDGGIDIARVHSSWIDQFKGRLAPLPSSVMTGAQFTETFYPAATAACRVGSAYYCLPLTYDGLALVYNKTLFSQAGIATPPATWEDFREAAVRLSQWEGNSSQGKLLQAGAALGASNVDYAVDILGLMLAQSNIRLPDELGEKAAQDVFSFFTNFVTKDKVWDATWPNSVYAFSVGKVGMIFVPSWETARLLKEAEVEIAVAPVPQIPTAEDGLTQIGWSNFWVDAVAAKSGNQTEAWKFLKFLSEKAAQQTVFAEATKLRGFGFPSSRKDLRSDLLTHPYLGAVVESAPVGQTGITVSCAGNPDYEDIFLQGVRRILANQSAASVLPEVKQQLSNLLSRSDLGVTGEERACALMSFGQGVGDGFEPPTEGTLPPETAAPQVPEPPATPVVTTPPATTPVVTPLACSSLTASPTSGRVPLEVNFSVRVSEPTRVRSFNFNFGDGQQLATSSAAIKHTYAGAGSYPTSVVVVATDGSQTVKAAPCQATVLAQAATPTMEPDKIKDTEPGFPLPLLATVFLGLLLLGLGFGLR